MVAFLFGRSHTELTFFVLKNVWVSFADNEASNTFLTSREIQSCKIPFKWQLESQSRAYLFSMIYFSPLLFRQMPFSEMLNFDI